MTTHHALPPRRSRTVLGLLILLLSTAAFVLWTAVPARAAVSCPNANPVVNENNCMGEGTTANQVAMENYSEELGGFTPQTSYELGENVPLKIGTDEPSFPGTNVNVSIYRIGYYGGDGARLIPTAGANNVHVNNSFQCNPENTTTGELSCSNWNVTYTIPGGSLPISGIYEAVFTDVADGGISNYVIFPVRNDKVSSEVLYVLPTADYQAYNTWGCKSLYFDACGGANTIAGDPRAVAVSFDRPQAEGQNQENHFFGPDVLTVEWLEQQGYNVSYTDDIQTDVNGSSLLGHKVDLISGHSEYWSAATFKHWKAAREAGVSILSLSANTAYWQTRYENNYRTLVCYKTIQGTASGNPGGTPNDPAATGPNGEIRPEFATTTRRDPGAPAGDPNAPPGGRIGPNEPENSLFGVMYIGDNDGESYKLTIPAGNANGEYASSRVWRNSGISTGSSTTLSEPMIGWEWDQIPTQPGYLAQEPAGVKRVSLTNVANPDDSFIQDAGRARASTPPPGEAPEVSAAEYRAPSGALVFASGTMEWAFGFDLDPVIDQATYNVLAEMGVLAATPASDITPETPGAPQPPWPSFTATPSTVFIGEPVSFNASASKDPDATITDYKWDLEGKGTFATDTGTTPTLTHTFTQPGTYSVILKVTDSKGQQETTERTVNVANTANAAIAASMNPVGAGQTDTFSAAGSTDNGGTITDYKWNLNGNGKYETDTGTTPTVTKAFATPGVYTVGVQVTDSKGAVSTATLSVTVISQGVSRYSDAVLATPSLLHYYPLDEAQGPTIADAKGNAPGTVTGAVFGVPGAVNGDPSTGVSFGGDGDPFEGEVGAHGEIPLNLSSQSAITVEFWLKWSAYGNNDALAMELTPNYNTNTGGFIVDPDAAQFGGTFAVGIGTGAAHDAVYFARPSAGVWHHYALVLNGNAPAASEITPYVDGQPVSYQAESSSASAGAFANSTLYLFSRDGNSLFGSGSLDDLAIYGGELNTATIQEHFDSNGPEPRPVASFAASPNPPRAAQKVTLNASASHYANGTITDYKWDLKGTGKYETDTGTTPTLSTSFATAGTYTVGLQVTDSDGAVGTTTQQISVGNFPPAAKLTASSTLVLTGQTVTLNAGESTDQGTITDYKWDTSGEAGKYETDTATNPTLTTSFQTVGQHTVSVQVTDSEGLTSTASVQVTVLAHGITNYEEEIESTPGLIDYYKLGEPAGPTIFDSKGSSNGTISGGTFGLPGAVREDPTTAIGFNGTSDSGAIPLNLSGTNKLTVEFWLKINQYTNDDALAMEFTPNFNENSGGFLVDPDADQFGGTFGIGLGSGSDRNSIFFPRPSAGVWHHYALVFDTTAPSASEITPYVDGEPVSYQQQGTDTGQGAFANSTLYLFSRDGNSLFGSGALDQLAIYNQPLSAATVFEHFLSHGTAAAPSASFTISANPVRPGQSVTLDASGSSATEGHIVEYQWDLDGSGKYATHTSSPQLQTSFASTGTKTIGLRVIDSDGTSASITHTLTVGNLPPVAKLAASPATVLAGQTVTLNAGESTDQGTITDYKWDTSGEAGKYETDTGTTPTLTTSFATAGTHTVSVEVTDSEGLSSQATVAVTVLEQAPAAYEEAVRNTPGLIDYYKLGEAQGPTILDSAGLSPGTITGGTFGLPGAVQKSTAIGFNGTSDSGAIPLNLSGTSQLTIEFWLKWNQYANNDSLAMEFTPNFNANPGGFLVDPNASQNGGTFGIGIGDSESRNSIFFARPSAGVWHHYALVINTAAPSGSEITPYVDGQPVSYQQESSNTGQGEFANSTLYLFSRDGNSLFGAGSLDELAIYNQALSASTVFAHYHSTDVDTAQAPSFTVNPSPAASGQSVTFDASGSTDSQGTITDYKWDLDGSGKYATDTGTSPTLTHSFEPGTYVIGLQSTDSTGAVARTTHTLTVTQAPPSKPTLTLSGASGQTSIAGNTVYIDPQSGNSGGFTVSAATSDPPASIKNIVFPALSGFGSGGATLTAAPFQSSYTWSGAGASATGAQPVTVTNNAGLSTGASFEVVPDTTAPSGGALTANGTAAGATASSSYNTTGSFAIARTDYTEAQSQSQSGLRSSTLTVASAPLSGNVCGTYGAETVIAGSPAQSEPTGCYRYKLTGIDNVGNQTSLTTTVMVDSSVPTTPLLSLSGLSTNTYYKSSTNTLYFRPAVGGAFTVTASSSDPDTGIAGYSFSSLSEYGFTGNQSGAQTAYSFGVSATQPPNGPTVSARSNAGASSASANYALIADTTAPTGGALTVNSVTATSAGSTSYNTSGSFTIGTRTDYNADTGSGLVSSVLTRASGTLTNGSCGAYGTPVTITGNPTQSGLAAGCYRYTLTGTDRVGNTATLTATVEVDKTAPSATVSVPADANGAVAVSFSATDAGSGVNSTGGQLKRAAGTYTPASDTCSAFAAFTAIGSTGLASPFTDSTVSTGHCYEYEYTVADKAGNSTTSTPATVKVNTTKPSLTAIADTTPGSTAGLPQVGDVLTLTFSDPIAAASIPSTVTLTYTGSALGSTTVAISGISGSAAWSSGDSSLSRYSKSGGTAATVTANTAVSGTKVTLTVTKVTDTSHNLTAGGPGAVSGTLNSSIKDVFGNSPSTSSFSSASIRLF